MALLTVTRVFCTALSKTTESLTRRAGVRVLVGLGVLLMAPSAWAQAPGNDNYLFSTQINGHNTILSQQQYHFTADTTLATVQNDLFVPDRVGGGGPEFTTCGPPDFGYGKTVWYDFHPHVDGRVRVLTTGFDTVVGVVPYNWDDALPFTDDWDCYDDPTPTSVEDISFDVTGGRSYSLQIGGYAGLVPYDLANADFGILELRFNYYPDRDHDGVLDNADQCISTRGSLPNGCNPAPDGDHDGIPDSRDACQKEDSRGRDAKQNGCLDYQTLSPFWDFDFGVAYYRHGKRKPAGIKVEHLGITQVPPRAKVTVSCSSRRVCKKKTQTASARGRAYFPSFKRKKLKSGTKVTIRITSSLYIGRWRTYTIKHATVISKPRNQGCLQPGQSRLRRSGTCSIDR